MLIFTLVSGTICIPWLPATQDVARLLPEEWVKIYWSLFHRRSIPVNDGFIEFDDVSCSILLIKLFKRKGKNVMPPLQSDHDGLHSERTPCKDRGWFRKWRGKTHTKVGIRESLTHRLRTYTYTYIYTYIYIYIICIYIYIHIFAILLVNLDQPHASCVWGARSLKKISPNWSTTLVHGDLHQAEIRTENWGNPSNFCCWSSCFPMKP